MKAIAHFVLHPPSGVHTVKTVGSHLKCVEEITKNDKRYFKKLCHRIAASFGLSN